MCGIAGIVGDIFSQEELIDKLKLACKNLQHRGPDQEGFYLASGIGLGISRLAIRDPKNGIQPMSRGALTLVFNGELYETKPLRDRLLLRGYSFQTECDTEVLLNALAEFGISIVSELVGMFAFALWDSNNKTLYLARDRWGEKPLYYTYSKDFLAFSSEIKGLRAWPHLSWVLSEEDILIFLRNSYLPNPRTGWKGVFKLEQGSILKWQEGNLSNQRYFSIVIKRENKIFSNRAKELFHLLDVSVKNSIASDRPIGAFLSGGIDSSTVAYFLSRYLKEAPIFSLHWDDLSYSEEVYTREVAQKLGMKHYTVQCDSSFFSENFDFIADLFDEPFADESMIPTYCLAKFAKQKIDVVLTGDGADEFFHGYERYFYKGSYENYTEIFAAISMENLRLICNPSFLGAHANSLLFSHNIQGRENLDEMRWKSWVDIHTYLPDDILVKVDRACMRVGLEARAPFLNHRVTDFALNCSTQELIGTANQGKEILRHAMKGYLPDVILQRKKMGFGVPLNSWFRSSLKEWAILRLLEGNLLKTGWFSRKGIERLFSNPQNVSRAILNLLVLEAWLRSHGKVYT